MLANLFVIQPNFHKESLFLISHSFFDTKILRCVGINLDRGWSNFLMWDFSVQHRQKKLSYLHVTLITNFSQKSTYTYHITWARNFSNPYNNALEKSHNFCYLYANRIKKRIFLIFLLFRNKPEVVFIFSIIKKLRKGKNFHGIIILCLRFYVQENFSFISI